MSSLIPEPDRCVLEVERHTHAREISRRLRETVARVSHPWPSPHDTWLVSVGLPREETKRLVGSALLRGVLVHSSEDTV